MKDRVVQLFNLTKDKILVDQNIPKNSFESLEKFSNFDKKVFSDVIKKISLLAVLNEDTINISAFKNEDLNYNELYFIYIELKQREKISFISEIIQSQIGNHCIIIFQIGSEILIQTSLKRLNKLNANEQIIISQIKSDWINLNSENHLERDFLNHLALENFSFMNFLKFHEDFRKYLLKFNLSKAIQASLDYKDTLSYEDLENHLNRHSEIKTEINKLEEEFKSLVELGDKVNFKQLILEKKKELAAYAEYVRKLVLYVAQE